MQNGFSFAILNRTLVKFWIWNYDVAMGNFPCFRWEQYCCLQFCAPSLPMVIKADKLPLETEPVACDNTSWILNPGHETFVLVYSTDNRSTFYVIKYGDLSKLFVSHWLIGNLWDFIFLAVGINVSVCCSCEELVVEGLI